MPTTSPVPGAGSESAPPSPDGVATRDESPPAVTSSLLAKVLGLVPDRGVRTD
jgi:hypothetical protein